jgi:hypothetical protein
MNKTLKAALAVFAATGIAAATHAPAANAQAMGSPETTVGGNTVYVEGGRDAGYTPQGHNGLNINGAVGLPLNPTAIIPNQGSVRVQANYFDGPRLSETGISLNTKYYGLFAAGRVGEMPLEISGGIAKFDANARSIIPGLANELEDTFDKTGLVLGAKYQLRGLADDPNGVRLAVGATYNRALLRNTNVYFVASKAFGVGSGRAVTGHLGVRYDRFSISTDADTYRSGRFSVYTGAEVPIDKDGRFAVVGEIGSKISDDLADGTFQAKVPYSLALRYQNGNGLGITGGVQRIGVLAGSRELNSSSSRFFVTAGQTF